MSNVHKFDTYSGVYNFFFHPLHRKSKQKGKAALAIITNIFITVATGGLWQIPFWVVNRLDNRKVQKLNKNLTSSVSSGTTKTQVFTTPSTNTQQPAPSQAHTPTAVEPENLEVSKVDIPKELENCFDILLGKGVLEKIPVFPRELKRGEAGFTKRNPLVSFASEEGKRDYINEMTFPIMKARGPDGSPVIILKVIAENPKAHYDPKRFPGKSKEDVVNELKTKEYAVIFREYFLRDEGNNNPLTFMQWQFADPSSPRLFAVVNLTEPRDGRLLMDGEGGFKTKQIRSFQNFFQNGIGKDSQRNVIWRIPDHEKIKALF